MNLRSFSRFFSKNCIESGWNKAVVISTGCCIKFKKTTGIPLEQNSKCARKNKKAPDAGAVIIYRF
jgi:hypothetical protein